MFFNMKILLKTETFSLLFSLRFYTSADGFMFLSVLFSLKTRAFILVTAPIFGAFIVKRLNQEGFFFCRLMILNDLSETDLQSLSF